MDTVQDIKSWSSEQVKEWLEENDFGKFCQNFIDNEIDGYSLVNLTERMQEQLIPVMKYRIKFIALLANLTATVNHAETCSNNAITDPVNDPLDSLPSYESPISVMTDIGQDISEYRLPRFPPSLMITLSTKREKTWYSAGTRLRRTIIEAIGSDLQTKDILRPSRKTYKLIVQQLLMEYPFLGDFNDWKLSLRTKMKTIRKPLVNDEKILLLKQKYGNAVQKKKRTLQEQCIEKATKRPKPAIELQDFVDEEEVTKLVNKLQEMSIKLNPNADLVIQLLQKTSKYRVNLVYEDKLPIQILINRFPILKRHEFLKYEAKSVYKICNTNRLDELVACAEIIEKDVHKKIKDFKTIQKEFMDLAESSVPNDRRDAAQLYCFKLLPAVFGERYTTFFCGKLEEIESSWPMIKDMGNNRFQVFIEGEQLLIQPRTFATVVDAWFYSFWVFGLEYPKDISSFCLFVERFFYLIGINRNLPKKLTNWASKLNLN